MLGGSQMTAISTQTNDLANDLADGTRLVARPREINRATEITTQTGSPLEGRRIAVTPKEPQSSCFSKLGSRVGSYFTEDHTFSTVVGRVSNLVSFPALVAGAALGAQTIAGGAVESLVGEGVIKNLASYVINPTTVGVLSGFLTGNIPGAIFGGISGYSTGAVLENVPFSADITGGLSSFNDFAAGHIGSGKAAAATVVAGALGAYVAVKVASKVARVAINCVTDLTSGIAKGSGKALLNFALPFGIGKAITNKLSQEDYLASKVAGKVFDGLAVGGTLLAFGYGAVVGSLSDGGAVGEYVKPYLVNPMGIGAAAGYATGGIPGALIGAVGGFAGDVYLGDTLNAVPYADNFTEVFTSVGDYAGGGYAGAIAAGAIGAVGAYLTVKAASKVARTVINAGCWTVGGAVKGTFNVITAPVRALRS